MTRHIDGVYRSLRLVHCQSGYRWACRGCGDSAKEPKARAEAEAAWLRHVNGPEHQAAVKCEAVARLVVRLVLGASMLVPADR